MGILLAKFARFFDVKPECKVLLVGLDGAGKTTILYRMKLGEIVTSVPTIGFNVETVLYKKYSFIVWDVGGQKKLRELWKNFYDNVNAMIFVIDGSDPAMFQEAHREFWSMMIDIEMASIPTLIFVNKMDISHRPVVDQVLRELDLQRIPHDLWRVQQSCAFTGEGLYQGFDWLITKMRKKNKASQKV